MTTKPGVHELRSDDRRHEFVGLVNAIALAEAYEEHERLRLYAQRTQTDRTSDPVRRRSRRFFLSGG